MTDWREQAACVGKPLEWFFPPSNGPALTHLGREVCASCPVVDACASEHARAERETGMRLPGLWAGTTERERRKLRPRLDARRGTPRSCVVCGVKFTDSGRGIVPRFCSDTCLQRANYRRRRGAPENDREFAVWRERRRRPGKVA